eukprot:7821384-Pyramimonas_sp.AAC.2
MRTHTLLCQESWNSNLGIRISEEEPITEANLGGGPNEWVRSGVDWGVETNNGTMRQRVALARDELADTASRMAVSLQNGVTSFADGEAAWKLVLKGSASLALAIGAYCAGVLMVTSIPWFLVKILGYMIMGFAFFGLYDVAIGCSSVSSRRLFG